jgi:hypothetical protein
MAWAFHFREILVNRRSTSRNNSTVHSMADAAGDRMPNFGRYAVTAVGILTPVYLGTLLLLGVYRSAISLSEVPCGDAKWVSSLCTRVIAMLHNKVSRPTSGNLLVGARIGGCHRRAAKPIGRADRASNGNGCFCAVTVS